MDEGRFGDGVDAEDLTGVKAAHRRDVDDRATAAAVLHVFCPRQLRQEQRGGHVDLERLLPAGEIDIDGRPGVGVGPGVVDQDVEPAEGIERGVDAGLRLRRVADVGGEPPHAVADLLGRRLAGVPLARSDHHLGPGLGIGLGDGLADAA